MNEHALAVDIGDLEVAHLGPAQTSCIQHHHHGAMHQVPRRIDQPCHLLLVQNGWQPPLPLGKWDVVWKVWPAQRLDEEKTDRKGAAFDGSRRKLALAKQIRLVLADMRRAKPFGRTMKVPRKVLHRIDVGTYGALRVVATLEFIQHHLPKMGHGNLL